MFIAVHLLVVVLCVKCSDHTGQRFHQGAFKEGLPVVFQKRTVFHDLIHQHDLCGVSPCIRIGIPRSKTIFRPDVRLDDKLVTRLKLIFPFFTYRKDHSAEFMPQDDRIFIDVFRHLFMFFTLYRRLIAGHAKAVCHDLSKNLILFDRRKFKFFQSYIFLSVQSYCFCLHSSLLPENLYAPKIPNP